MRIILRRDPNKKTTVELTHDTKKKRIKLILPSFKKKHNDQKISPNIQKKSDVEVDITRPKKIVFRKRNIEINNKRIIIKKKKRSPPHNLPQRKQKPEQKQIVNKKVNKKKRTVLEYEKLLAQDKTRKAEHKELDIKLCEECLDHFVLKNTDESWISYMQKIDPQITKLRKALVDEKVRDPETFRQMFCALINEIIKSRGPFDNDTVMCKFLKYRFQIMYEFKVKILSPSYVEPKSQIPNIHALHDILNSLLAHPESKLFGKPIDPLKNCLTHYFRIVKTPLCLGDVQQRLNDRIYTTNDAFASDVRLVFENALSFYNNSDATGKKVRQIAQNVLDMFNSKFKALVELQEKDKKAQEKEKQEAEKKQSKPDGGFEVEEIIGEALDEFGQKRYLVWWKGYTKEESTWEPLDNLIDAPEAIQNWRDTKRYRKSIETKAKIEADPLKPKRNTTANRYYGYESLVRDPTANWDGWDIEAPAFPPLAPGVEDKIRGILSEQQRRLPSIQDKLENLIRLRKLKQLQEKTRDEKPASVIINKPVQKNYIDLNEERNSGKIRVSLLHHEKRKIKFNIQPPNKRRKLDHNRPKPGLNLSKLPPPPPVFKPTIWVKTPYGEGELVKQTPTKCTVHIKWGDVETKAYLNPKDVERIHDEEAEKQNKKNKIFLKNINNNHKKKPVAAAFSAVGPPTSHAPSHILKPIGNKKILITTNRGRNLLLSPQGPPRNSVNAQYSHSQRPMVNSDHIRQATQHPTSLSMVIDSRTQQAPTSLKRKRESYFNTDNPRKRPATNPQQHFPQNQHQHHPSTLPSSHIQYNQQNSFSQPPNIHTQNPMIQAQNTMIHTQNPQIKQQQQQQHPVIQSRPSHPQIQPSVPLHHQRPHQPQNFHPQPLIPVTNPHYNQQQSNGRQNPFSHRSSNVPPTMGPNSQEIDFVNPIVVNNLDSTIQITDQQKQHHQASFSTMGANSQHHYRPAMNAGAVDHGTAPHVVQKEIVIESHSLADLDLELNSPSLNAIDLGVQPNQNNFSLPSNLISMNNHNPFLSSNNNSFKNSSQQEENLEPNIQRSSTNFSQGFRDISTTSQKPNISQNSSQVKNPFADSPNSNPIKTTSSTQTSLQPNHRTIVKNYSLFGISGSSRNPDQNDIPSSSSFSNHESSTSALSIVNNIGEERKKLNIARPSNGIPNQGNSHIQPQSNVAAANTSNINPPPPSLLSADNNLPTFSEPCFNPEFEESDDGKQTEDIEGVEKNLPLIMDPVLF